MLIAIKKLPNNQVYIDKYFADNFGIENADKFGYSLLEIDDKYSDCVSSDFNDDLTFNIDKYNNRNYKETADVRIAELKRLLAKYDYIGIKIATGRATREEYAIEIAQMTAWADEINELEARKYLEVNNAVNQKFESESI